MSPRRERFALADLMIVVAASALSVALLRATVDSSGGGYLRHVPDPSHRGGPAYELSYAFFFLLYNGVPQIFVGLLCVVALTLRARRASALQLSDRPGFVLSLVAVTASAWTVLVNFPALRWNEFDAHVDSWELVVHQILPNAGFAVLGSWLTLMIMGRGKSAPSWIDRTGYALAAVLGTLLALDHVRLLLENAQLI